MGAIFAVLAAAAAIAAPASAVYDQNGNVIYIYQTPDGTLVYSAAMAGSAPRVQARPARPA